MPATNSEPEVLVRRILPTDVEWHRKTAAHLADMPTFWEDRMRVNMVATYISVFCHPDNFVVDLNSAATMAFQRSANGIRAWLFGAVWDPAGSHTHTARRVVSKAALLAMNVQRIEGITALDNVPARKSMEKMGMHFRGRIPQGLWYNGTRTDGVWYEFDREEDFGLHSL